MAVKKHREKALAEGRIRLAGILSLAASQRLEKLMTLAPFQSRVQVIEAALIALEKSGAKGAREAMFNQMEETQQQPE